ncbi:hypothetical protein D3C83_17700 [compost metagenome]
MSYACPARTRFAASTPPIDSTEIASRVSASTRAASASSSRAVAFDEMIRTIGTYDSAAPGRIASRAIGRRDHRLAAPGTSVRVARGALPREPPLAGRQAPAHISISDGRCGGTGDVCVSTFSTASTRASLVRTCQYRSG